MLEASECQDKVKLCAEPMANTHLRAPHASASRIFGTIRQYYYYVSSEARCARVLELARHGSLFAFTYSFSALLQKQLQGVNLTELAQIMIIEGTSASPYQDGTPLVNQLLNVL